MVSVSLSANTFLGVQERWGLRAVYQQFVYHLCFEGGIRVSTTSTVSTTTFLSVEDQGSTW